MRTSTGAVRRSTGCCWATRPSTSTPSPGWWRPAPCAPDRPGLSAPKAPRRTGTFGAESPRGEGNGTKLTEIRYEVADGVATITLDRPDHRNAFSGTMADELAHAAGQADADDDVRVVL